MELVEQNISDGKLEKLRRDAVRKNKIRKILLPLCLILFAALAVGKNLWLFAYLGEDGWGGQGGMGVLSLLAADLIAAVIAACVIFLFYMMLVWKKAYDRFNFSFKNKYVLETIRQLPGFSQLRYNAQSGFSFEEMDRMNLIPKGGKAFYESSDELTGLLDGVRFRSSRVCTGRKASGRRSLPEILFEGQVIAFSDFDPRKVSESFVQVFSKKTLPQVKRTTAPLNIQTENSLFNENFVVFSEREENAFYILTPQVLERIAAFQEAMEGSVYLSFFQNTMYVTCSQLRNPFDVCLDLPIEAQRQRLEKDTAILRSARAILGGGREAADG